MKTYGYRYDMYLAGLYAFRVEVAKRNRDGVLRSLAEEGYVPRLAAILEDTINPRSGFVAPEWTTVSAPAHSVDIPVLIALTAYKEVTP